MQEIEANVSEVIQETPNIKTIRFGDFFDFKPGDHIIVNKQKPLTISSSPTEGFLQITKKITDSDFSKKINSLKKNDKLVIEGPISAFPFNEERNAVMLSGGIGVTPLRSMVKYAYDKKLPIKIVLLYSNRSSSEIAFFEELKKTDTENIRIVNTITGDDYEWDGRRGRINEELIKEFSVENPIYYSSGPPKMVEIMVELLKKMGVNRDSIRSENFSGY